MDRMDVPLRDRIIFALDVPDVERAKAWVERLEEKIGFFKVGLQLFLAGGFEIVEWIRGRGHKVMLDLKFFDVPETVRLAVRQLSGKGVTFATVHAFSPVMTAAAEAAGDVKILAVTVLTSFGAGDAHELGVDGPIDDLVVQRAQRAVQCGCDGIVCSGLEVKKVRKALGYGFYVVTPGIRPLGRYGVRRDDQKRIVTPEQAISNGADHLVIGRPIRDARDPLGLVVEIQRTCPANMDFGSVHTIY